MRRKNAVRFATDINGPMTPVSQMENRSCRLSPRSGAIVSTLSLNVHSVRLTDVYESYDGLAKDVRECQHRTDFKRD